MDHWERGRKVRKRARRTQGTESRAIFLDLWIWSSYRQTVEKSWVGGAKVETHSPLAYIELGQAHRLDV